MMLKDFARWVLRDEIDGYKAAAYRNFATSRERWIAEHHKVLGDLYVCEFNLAEMYFKNVETAQPGEKSYAYPTPPQVPK